MPSVRLSPALLCCAVGLWTGSLDADGPVRSAAMVVALPAPSLDRSTSSLVEMAVPEMLPFEHRVGDVWRIVVQRRDGPVGAEEAPVTVESEAEVVSPLGRDRLVEVRAIAWTEGERTEPLVPRTPENAARLDARGGGRLALRVDRRGTALDVVNASEVRAALERAHRTTLDDAAWSAERGALLEEWNSVYQSCGVPLPLGQAHVTPLHAAERRVGEASATLSLEAGPRGEAAALRVRTQTRVDPRPGPGEAWSESTTARFDLVQRRLEGTRVVVVQRAGGGPATSVRLAFREDAVPDLAPLGSVASR